MQMLWNVNEVSVEKRRTCKNKPGGGGSYHVAHAPRSLENHCNEADHNSIQERMNEKSTNRIKHEEDVVAKSEYFKEELGAATAQSKRKRGGMEQKIPSKLSHQCMCFSSMTRFFICLSFHSPFNALVDESFLQMIGTVARQN